MKSKTKQARVSGTLDPIVRLPKWAQRRIAELEERVKRAEATIPWTSPGMEWFTLFWPGPDPRYRAPESLFTCDKGGTHMVCTLGPTDWVFIGRGKKPNATDERRGIPRTLDPIVGLIDCPQCGKQFDQTVCSCGYEHSCGGPSEACCIPGCSECGTKPNAELSGPAPLSLNKIADVSRGPLE